MLFLNRRHFLTAIIDSREIKAVLLDDKNRLVKMASAVTPVGAFNDERIHDPAVLAEALGSLIKDWPSLPKEISFCLPDSQCFFHLFKIKSGLTEDERLAAIATEAKAVIPVEPEAISWNYLSLGTRETEVEAVLYLGALTEELKAYQEVAKGAGLALGVIEAESIALGRALLSTEAQAPQAGVTEAGRAILKASDSLASVGVYDVKGRLIISSVTPLPQPATAVATPGTDQALVSVDLKPDLSAVASEIKLAAHFAKESFGLSVGQVLLTGHWVENQQVISTLSTALGLPVIKGDPLLYLTKTGDQISALSPWLYAGPIGLALHSTRPGWPVDLVATSLVKRFKPNSITEERSAGRRPWFSRLETYLILVIILLVVGSLSYLFWLKDLFN